MSKFVSALLLAMLLAAGCSSAKPEGQSTLAGLFAQMPQEVFNSGAVAASDWTLAVDPADIRCIESEVATFVLELSRVGAWIVGGAFDGPVWSVAPDEMRADVGFALCEVVATASFLPMGTASFLPLALTAERGDVAIRSLDVFTVTVAEETVDERLRADPVWSDDLLVMNEGTAGEFYQWGESASFQDTDRRTALRWLGRGGALAVRDPHVLRSTRPATIELALATSSSVLDVPGVTGILSVLEAEGAHTVELARQIAVAHRFPAGVDGSAEGALLFDMAGFGVGYDSEAEAVFMTIVVANEPDVNAEDATARIAQLVNQGDPRYMPIEAEQFVVTNQRTQDNLSIVRVGTNNPIKGFMNMGYFHWLLAAPGDS